ncbi:DUF2892 domain-containing protein [Leptospira gomenensis]|uniref:DUF2892 domain-containing protein n=1 Tax=Leptospira gomenensis TaxID=2484974 RepID=A0A5F1YX36_9LEPT|nr:DUF2892 domain-containing protein [Leptospira gomenensis]TGK32607.1 DUF2892 domain-containing protein [Leptospira gomenensis]TGK38337.1 DUF2892 domain-containing protein [Leptospira gomenensis]TGK52151.1 DUF2892 domain-containing protein [Leptospira gomenensis]TGK62995.1 DUF2892 domain-containing protein [Leptospira gomenensis]
MQVNEGTIDRILRVAAGVGLMVFGYWTGGGFGTGMMIFGLIPLATGLLGWCPLYTVLGISTCPIKK